MHGRPRTLRDGRRVKIKVHYRVAGFLGKYRAGIFELMFYHRNLLEEKIELGN